MGVHISLKAGKKEGRLLAAFPSKMSQFSSLQALSADMTSPNSSQVSFENLASFTDWIG
jgi:hypothetical protein